MNASSIKALSTLVLNIMGSHESNTRVARAAAVPGALTGFTRTDIAIPLADGKTLHEQVASTFPVETIEAGGVVPLLKSVANLGQFVVTEQSDPRNPARTRAYVSLRRDGYSPELRALSRQELQARQTDPAPEASDKA